MNNPLKVGIIGANAQASWAKDSHVPALQGLSELELAAIATSNIDTARAAAQAFGAPQAFAGGLDLIHVHPAPTFRACNLVNSTRSGAIALQWLDGVIAYARVSKARGNSGDRMLFHAEWRNQASLLQLSANF